MDIVLIIGLLWIISFVAVRGYSLAWFLREFSYISWSHYEENKATTFHMSLFGPLAILSFLFVVGRFWKHGWLWPGEKTEKEAIRVQREARGELQIGWK
jgi:hypothetical protein